MIITQHALEKWMIRIVDKERYKHLDMCRKDHCIKCSELKSNIYEILNSRSKPYIFRAINEEFIKSQIVNDPELIKKILIDSDTPNHLVFLSKRAIFIIKKDGEEFVMKSIYRVDFNRLKDVVSTVLSRGTIEP